MTKSLLYRDFESFAGGNHVGMEFLRVTEDLFDIGIFMMRIVVVECDTFDLSLDSRLDSLPPTAVTPAAMLGQFFRRVLRIDNEEVRIFCQREYVLVAP